MRRIEFSKLLVILETVIVGYLTFKGVRLAEMCVEKSFTGSLPWVATMVSCAWAAYGTSAGFYYNKSKAENVQGGIKYESVINTERDA
jgi:hypothetical protein